CYVLPEQQHLPRRGRKNSGDEIEQRCLAGAVRADDGLSVSRHDLERDVAYGMEAAETFGKPVQLEHGLAALRWRVLVHARWGRRPDAAPRPIACGYQQYLHAGTSRL